MGTTTGGLPYPEPADGVAQGATAIKSLAEAVDTKKVAGVGLIQSGKTTVTTTGPNTFTITFPKQFTSAPVVVAVPHISGSGVFHACYLTANATASAFSGRAFIGSPPAATAEGATFTVAWIAIGPGT